MKYRGLESGIEGLLRYEIRREKMKRARWLEWPDLMFPPMNLWTVVPAKMFYATHIEQTRMVWDEPFRDDMSQSRTPRGTRINPLLKRMHEIIAQY